MATIPVDVANKIKKKNIYIYMEKGENAVNQYFLPFPHCFHPIKVKLHAIHVIHNHASPISIKASVLFTPSLLESDTLINLLTNHPIIKICNN